MGGFAFGSTGTGTAGAAMDLQRRAEEERRRGLMMQPGRIPVFGGGVAPSIAGPVPVFGGPSAGSGSATAGGGTPSFGGMRHQAPFSSDRDGSTVAKVNHGAAAYHGLAPFDEQFSGAKPQMTSWGQEWGEASKPAPPQHIDPITGKARLPAMADGGPVPHGMPFIAGDPQKDGKPNPEVIVPVPGGIHVVPLRDMKMGRPVSGFHGDAETRRGSGLKPPLRGLEEFYQLNPHTPTAAQVNATNLILNPKVPLPIRLPSEGTVPVGHSVAGPLPKFAYGTEHVPNWSNTYDPSLVAAGLDGGAGNFGRVLPFSGEQPGLEARDANGNVAGFATGGSAASMLPAFPDPDPASQRPATALRPIETAEQYAARRESMNPDQIRVGFDPRAPLHGFADADKLANETRASGRGAHDLGRLEREVMRAARGNPYLASQVLGSHAADVRSQNEAQARMALEQFQQGQLNNRETQKETGRDSRFDATQQGKVEASNAKRQDTGNKMAVEMMGQQQRFASMVQSGRIPQADAVSLSQIAHPDALKSRLDYYEFNQGKQETHPDGILAPQEQTPTQPARVPFRLPSQVANPSAGGPAAPSTPQDMEPYPVAWDVATGKPTKHALRPKAAAKTDPVALLSEMAKVDAIVNSATASPDTKAAAERHRKKLMKDFDGDGVPDAAQGGAPPAPTGMAARAKALMR